MSRTRKPLPLRRWYIYTGYCPNCCRYTFVRSRPRGAAETRCLRGRTAYMTTAHGRPYRRPSYQCGESLQSVQLVRTVKAQTARRALEASERLDTLDRIRAAERAA